MDNDLSDDLIFDGEDDEEPELDINFYYMDHFGLWDRFYRERNPRYFR